MPHTALKSDQTKQSSVGEALEVLPAVSTSRDVLDALSRMIEANGLGIGDGLPPEIEIARRLGIGRAKVREALIAWQNMGNVIRNKKAGTRLEAEVFSNTIHLPVTLKLEAESLLPTQAVRRPLEIECVRLAAQRCSEQDGKIVIARMRELMATYDAGQDWRPADYRFHSAMHAACGDPLFGQLIQQIQQAVHEVYSAPFGQPHLGQSSVPLHGPLAEAIIAKEVVKATGVTEEIMDTVESDICKVMKTLDV